MATHFSIQGLKAEIEGKEILKGINLEMKGGEIHASWVRTVPVKVPWLPL
ncbi:Vegetative protein 296 [Paenibacillus sp. P1XP2]|nr:Vegetative protein 296 [Paenibacillus sp. P1XP2]